MSKVPPYDTEAERACLGACLMSADALDKVSEDIVPDDFYHLVHQELYAAMLQMVNKNYTVDFITVSNYLRQQNKLDKVGGPAYLDRLSSTGTAVHLETYIHIVADKAVERRLIQAGNSILKLGYEGEEEVSEKVDKAEEVLFAVTDARLRSELLPVRHTLSDTFEQLFDTYKLGNIMPGLPTGWPELDNMIGGLQDGNLIIVGARPSMGKTAFALNLASHAALGPRKATVAIFSLEMSRDEIQSRLICSEAQINNTELRTGRLSEQEWQRMARRVDNLLEAPIYIDDQGGQSVLEIKSKLRRLSKKTPVKLVIIDYLQLMRGSAQFNYGPVNRVQEISEITRQLKLLAKDLHVPIVALSQLSRSLENRQDKRPIMADLRESGSIEQDADLIAFLYRDVYYNPASPAGNTVEVIVAKQRNGPVGTVELVFEIKYGRFESLCDEMAWREQDML